MFTREEQEYAINGNIGMVRRDCDFRLFLFHSDDAIHYNLVKRMQMFLPLSQ